MATNKDKRINLAENIAAVTAVFHENSTRYEKFYHMYQDDLGGFPGIWHLCGVAGLAFAKAEGQLRPDWDGEWVGAVDSYVDSIYREGPNLSDEKFLELAKQAIRQRE